ncbi:unnamed protein product [Blepharisma stoltei]|uniref:PAS domain-containing protein n=1 Tax=Blepharisma stoltei TaxID=1481888 RepID=A0AAU9J8D8_9CILI|nr:unnamed protein product [Blepharisma stoltei]
MNFRKCLISSETLWSRIKSAIFQTFYDIYNDDGQTQSISRSEKPLVGIVNILITLQMMTQLWYPEINISNWDAYSLLWNAISFSSIDFICASFNNGLSFCFYSGIAFVFIMTMGLISLTFFCFIKKKIHPIFILILRKIILFSKSIGHIPIMMVIIIWVKFSSNRDKVSENYPYSAEYSGSLKFNNSLQGLGIAFVILFNIILVSAEIFSTETRHSYFEKNILARSRSFPDVLGCICNSIFACVFTFIEKKFWIYGLYAFSITYFIIGLIFYLQIPYYNALPNYIKVGRHLVCSFTACSFMIGIYMNNAQVIFLTVLVINPLLTLISLYSLNWRISNIKIKAPQNQFSFELKMRNQLIAPKIENKQEMINRFSDCFSNKNFRLGKLLGVWEAYFCVDGLKDVRLATVKLAQVHTIDSNIEECYQEFICNKNLKHEGYIMYEDTAFLKYLKNMNKVKNDDKGLLFDILNFSDEISLRRPSTERIQKYSKSISFKVNFLKKKYSKLVLRFPNMASSKMLYGSFLRDILNEKDSNYFMFINNESSKQAPVKLNDLGRINTFDETHGILWTSAEKNNFGDIIYVNEIFSQMLGYQVSDLLESSLKALIPYPFYEFHNKVINKYIQSCTDLEAKVPTTLFMQNKAGLLVECTVRSRFIALNSYRFFLTSVSQIDTSRECALLSEDYNIYNYTSNFISWLDTPNESIKDRNIIKYIPDYQEIAKNPFVPCLTSLNGKKVAIVHEVRHFSTINMNIALIVSDHEEIKAWTQGIHEDQTVYQYGGEKTNSRLTEALSMEIYGKKDIEEVFKIASEHLLIENKKIKEKMSDIEDKSAGASSTLSKFFRNLKAGTQHNLISQSILSIKIFGWVVFWTLLAIIVASTAQLIYSSQEIYAASSIDTISDLGQVLYTLANIGINARLSDWSYRVKSNFVKYNLEILNNSLSELMDAEASLLENSGDWAYCSSTNLINFQVIPTWSYINNNTMVLSKANLIDGIQEFVKHAVHYLTVPYDLDAHYGDLYFLVNNGIGNFYIYLNQTFDSLVDCEIQKINDLSRNIYILYAFDVTVLIGGLVILAVFGIRLNKMQDKLWAFLIKISQMVMQNIRENCINRLYEVHGCDAMQIKPEIVFKNGIRIKANYIWSVLWRISIIFICALVFETVRTFVLYENCQQLLAKRSDFLKIATLRRNYLVEINMWFREANAVARNLTFYQFYPESYLFNNWHSEFYSLINKIKYVNNRYHSPEFMGLISDSTLNDIYSNSSYPGFPWLDYGTYASYNLALQDVYQSAFNGFNTRYVYNFTTFTVNNENEIISKINLDSKDKVTSQVNFIFSLSLLYMIFSFVACFVYYIPYLRNEIKKLRELQDLIHLLETPLI